jgi:hypothetical protein
VRAGCGILNNQQLKEMPKWNTPKYRSRKKLPVHPWSRQVLSDDLEYLIIGHLTGMPHCRNSSMHISVNLDARMLCLVIQETSAECSRYKLGKYTHRITPLGHYVHVVLS